MPEADVVSLLGKPKSRSKPTQEGATGDWLVDMVPETKGWKITLRSDKQAGPFDLKPFFEAKGQTLKCDAYYRVKLAVSNQCVSWRDTIRLVKLKCCPGEVISLPQP